MHLNAMTPEFFSVEPLTMAELTGRRKTASHGNEAIHAGRLDKMCDSESVEYVVDTGTGEQFFEAAGKAREVLLEAIEAGCRSFYFGRHEMRIGGLVVRWEMEWNAPDLEPTDGDLRALLTQGVPCDVISTLFGGKVRRRLARIKTELEAGQ